ncbi:MAG TPA: lanthionine synthetase LanC family protein [Pseudonocardiaceae bacterium]|nr:lanthionine synthetase LanC family protein [Pseudonocardiaceae bacterium]
MTAADSARLALAIAERLLDANAVAAALSEQARGTMSGLAGTALLHARLSAVDDRFATAAIEHWNRAAAHTRHNSCTAGGTFAGPGAVAASLILGSAYLPDPHQRHDQCAAAARWLAARALAIADQTREHRRSGAPPASWAVYDAIGGLAGIGRILMVAVDQGHRHAGAGVDAALRTLSAMINTRFGSRPGWWLPAEAHPATTAVHPSGAAATGIAHGIAGPLALLSTAHAARYRVPGQGQAIRTAADWLLRWREPATDTWPPHITGHELDHDTAVPAPGRRDAWCYGAAGISSALRQAARALADDRYRAIADHAMRTLTAREPRSWDVEGPILCHGYAGILQASHDHPDLAEHAATRIIADSDPRHRYIIQHSEHGTTHDYPGLLTGATGAALALADHAKLPTIAPTLRWDYILLLS